MNEIEEVSGRIMAAMERLSNGVEALTNGASGEVDRLRAALDGEKSVNTELTERVQALEERQEQAIAALEAKAREATDRVAVMDKELQQLKAANSQLITACDALRDANAAGVADPGLINTSMQAQLDAMRALRSAEMAEAQEIISALTPLLQASAQTPQPQESV